MFIVDIIILNVNVQRVNFPLKGNFSFSKVTRPRFGQIADFYLKAPQFFDRDRSGLFVSASTRGKIDDNMGIRASRLRNDGIRKDAYREIKSTKNYFLIFLFRQPVA